MNSDEQERAVSSIFLKPKWAGYVFVSLVALTAGVLFRVVVPERFHAGINPDFVRYYAPVARSIASGGDAPELPAWRSTRYPPGYSAILSVGVLLSKVTGIRLRMIVSLGGLLSFALASMGIFAIAKRVVGANGAIVPAIVWICYPPNLWLSTCQNADLLFIAILSWTVWLHIRLLADEKPKSLWTTAAVLGMADAVLMLVRPVAVAFPVFSAAALAFRYRHVRAGSLAAIVTVMVSALVVLPWQIQLQKKLGRFALLSTNVDRAFEMGLVFGTDQGGWREHSLPDDVRDFVTQFRRPTCRIRPALQLGKQFLRAARADPIPAARFVAIKAARAWYGTESGRRHGVQLLIQLVFLPLVVWGFIRAYHAGGIARWYVFAVAGLACYFWATTILVVPMLRYMVPVIGLGLAAAAVVTVPGSKVQPRSM